MHAGVFAPMFWIKNPGQMGSLFWVLVPLGATMSLVSPSLNSIGFKLNSVKFLIDNGTSSMIFITCPLISCITIMVGSYILKNYGKKVKMLLLSGFLGAIGAILLMILPPHPGLLIWVPYILIAIQYGLFNVAYYPCLGLSVEDSLASKAYGVDAT